METTRANLITCMVYKTIAPNIALALKSMGIPEYHVAAARAIVLKEKAGFMGIGAGIALDEDPSEIFSFYVPSGSEEAAINSLIAAGELSKPGRGSVYCEEVDVAECAIAGALVEASDLMKLVSELYGICCIVQRGQGNSIAHAALDLGFAVPQVTFGEGTGLRDKLGLLRITIPAEKEVVHLTVSSQDVHEAMNVLIDVGRLDQPGKGFIYVYPVGRGLINTSIFRGKQKHAASMEQVIAAIDDIKGNLEWRQRSTGGEAMGKRRKFLSDLVEFRILCNEGRAQSLVHAAMSAGAAGATISQLRYKSVSAEKTVSPAREMSDLIVGKGQVEAIAAAIEAAGVFDEETGSIQLKNVPTACTYLG
jgi:nitrogen regulatory protein PII